MLPSHLKNDFLHKFKEDENEIEELSRIEETELLQSPRFRRLQSSSPPRSNPSSPLKSNISKMHENSSFEKKPNLQYTPKDEVPKTPTKSKSRHKRVGSSSRAPPPRYSFNSPTKLHNSKFTEAKVSLTPAQRFEKKPGKLLSTKDILSSYEFKETIGRGAFANVYRAINKLTGDEVAIKEIFIEDDDDILELMCEIDLLKILKHRNIVKYHGFIKNDKKLLIFLEYCSGGSLRNLYKKNGPLTEEQVVEFLKEMLQGLIYLHGQGVVHRDVKAANILLTNQGDIKLTDFGVSTKVSTTTIKTYSIAGTPNWMAPEIISMDGTSTASDIWSLGATIVELLTGEPLYSHLNEMAALHAIVTDEYPPIPTFISSDCKDFLLQCFEKQPGQRITAKGLLKHKWLQDSYKTTSLDRTLFDNSTFTHKPRKKHSNNDFNTIKRFNSKKFLPLDLSTFKHSEQEINSIIDVDLVDHFDNLDINDSNFKISSPITKSLFEPMDFNNSTSSSQTLRQTLMDNCYNATVINEVITEVRNKNSADTLFTQDLLFKLLLWIENNEENEKLILSYLELLSLAVNASTDMISKLLSFGGIAIITKLILNIMGHTVREKALKLLDNLFESDQTSLKVYVEAGGIVETLKLLQEDYKSTSKLPEFAIGVLHKSFQSSLVSNDIIQFMVFNTTNTIDWIGILLMEFVHSSNNSAVDSTIEVINYLQTSETSLIRPIFLNSIFKVHEKLSYSNQIILLKFLKRLNSNEIPKTANILKFLVKTIQQVLSQKNLRPEILNLCCSMVFSCCHLNQEKQAELIKLHAFPLFQDIINSTLPCTEYIIPLLCEFPLNQLLHSFVAKEKETLLRNFSELLIDPVWQANALDSLVAFHDKFGTDDSVAEYLLNDEYNFLVHGFLLENTLNFELYLERLIKFLNSYGNSLAVNEIRLSLFNNGDVLDHIFKKIASHKSDLVVQINLFKLLKILSSSNSRYENFGKISKRLIEARPTKVLLIDQLINEILEDGKAKEDSTMRPPTSSSRKLIFK